MTSNKEGKNKGEEDRKRPSQN